MIVAGSLSSCYFFKKKEEEKPKENLGNAIARVKGKYLYDRDIKDLFSEDLFENDSILLRKRYINSWIKNQILLDKAENNIPSLKEIEDKVSKYRYDLILYEYQRKYIDQKLNKTVTEEEIVDYYNKNKSDFELKQNIVKCEFVRLHKNTPKLNKNLKLYTSKNKRNVNKFKEYVMQFSDSYSFDSDIWYDFNDVVNNTPFANYQNQIQFLKKNKFAQESDTSYVYLIKIMDYKISDQVSPIEFVKEKIADVIINKRKVELLKQLEEGVYESAKENNEFEIYN